MLDCLDGNVLKLAGPKLLHVLPYRPSENICIILMSMHHRLCWIVEGVWSCLWLAVNWSCQIYSSAVSINHFVSSWGLLRSLCHSFAAEKKYTKKLQRQSCRGKTDAEFSEDFLSPAEGKQTCREFLIKRKYSKSIIFMLLHSCRLAEITVILWLFVTFTD